jgi:hypothetical protein
MSEPLKAGQTVSCVLTVVGCLEMRALNYEMADGNGVVVMSREKLTKSYTTVKPRSRATRFASPFCAHIDYTDNRRVGLSQGNTITRNARDGDPAVKIVRKGVSRCWNYHLERAS